MERRRILGLLGGSMVAALVPGLCACGAPARQPSPPQPPPRPNHFYEYYYYPDVDVYFQIYTGTYHYRSNGVWWRASRLPPHIRLNPSQRTIVVVQGAPPYELHQRHRPVSPPPTGRPDPRLDREERERNRRLYDRYLRRWKP